MIDFIAQVRIRNESLYYFGLVCFLLSLVFLGLTKFSNTQVFNVSAWYKPFKFAFSIFLFSWTMAWYCHYLTGFNPTYFNWTVIILFGFEIFYITFQAAKSELSHFNISTSVYAALYSAMAFAASAVTLYTAYIGILFFVKDFPSLPSYYVWAMRMGILIFVVFSFQGFAMGARLTHTIGGPDGSPGIWLLGWSKTFGDPRIAHFIGMHALQVLPVVAYYFVKSTKGIMVISAIYFALATFTLVQALQGKPLIKNKVSIDKTISK